MSRPGPVGDGVPPVRPGAFVAPPGYKGIGLGYDNAMSASSIYLKHEMAIKDLPAFCGSPTQANLGCKWYFVGIDMAPIDSLETGVAVLDRQRRLVRMDKLNDDANLLLFLDNLGPADNLVVSLDIPKSLNIASKWRQQQVKMHPLQLDGQALEVPTDRFAQRAKDFYDAVTQRGILITSFFTPHAKLRYELNTPYRSRSPQGCRALQALLKQRLHVQDVPSNLAPSSVLDAMVGAYSSWLLVHGVEQQHFRLYRDDERRLYFDPLQRLIVKRTRARHTRRFSPPPSS